MPDSERSRLTFRWDLVRGVGFGLVETCFWTFVLLVAIRVYHAPDWLKAGLQASFSGGFILSALVLPLFARTGLRLASICGLLCIGAAVLLIATASASSLTGFAIAVVAAMILWAQQTPLSTQIYATNYAASERGNRVSTQMVLAGTVGVAFAAAGGELLDRDIARFTPVVFLITALGALIAAGAFFRIPSEPLDENARLNPWVHLKVAWQDKTFVWLLSLWMVMGLGNLMTIPIRVEYMANPLYGINAGNDTIAIVTGAIPTATRLLSIRIWGALFDKLNFIVLRILVNLLMFFGILAFFFTESILLMGIAAGVFGVSLGAGRIMWQLWVTKIAAPEKVGHYMSIHSSFTGLRGILAPFLGYSVLSLGSPTAVGWLGALLIGIATIFFIPLRERFATGVR